VKGLLAVWLALALNTLSADAARLDLPPLPHYQNPLAPPPPVAPISPPHYTEPSDQRQAAGNTADNQSNDSKTLWQRLVAIFDRSLEDPIAFLTLCLVIANFALALSTFGLWIVTGISGKRQSRDMRSSIRQQRRTINAMESTERRQLRAYVGIEKLAIECPSANNTEYRGKRDAKIARTTPGFIHKDFVVTTIRNFGQTPAHDVVVYTNWAWTRYPNRLPPNFFVHNDRDVVSSAPIRPTIARYMLEKDKEAVSKSVIFDVRPFKAAMKRRFYLYIFGQIYYRDVFDRWWRTRFCEVWEPWHPGSERFVPYEEYSGEDQKRLLDTNGNPV
jgi:hypothetical protein